MSVTWVCVCEVWGGWVIMGVCVCVFVCLWVCVCVCVCVCVACVQKVFVAQVRDCDREPSPYCEWGYSPFNISTIDDNGNVLFNDRQREEWIGCV